MSNHSKCSELV